MCLHKWFDFIDCTLAIEAFWSTANHFACSTFILQSLLHWEILSTYAAKTAFHYIMDDKSKQ